MIEVKALVSSIRKRLRDDKEPFRFETLEIIDTLNNVYNDLNYQFKLNVNKFEKKISNENNVLNLPKMALSFEKAFLNGKELPLKAYNEFSKELIISAYSNFQSFAVLPKNQANGDLILFANLAYSFDENGKLNNADFLNIALIYGSLALLFQIESNENNLQRVSFYENLFKKECDRLRAVISSVYEKKNFLSPCILV